jgi:hypothetical protein
MSAMPSDSSNRCRTPPLHRRDRQFLPAARQKIPPKILKDNKKNRLNFLAASFNDWKPYGVCTSGHCGLEIEG